MKNTTHLPGRPKKLRYYYSTLNLKILYLSPFTPFTFDHAVVAGTSAMSFAEQGML